MDEIIDKRIDKLNSKIIKINKKIANGYSKSIEKTNKKYAITSIGVGALPILTDAVNVVLLDKPLNGSDICMELAVGIMTVYCINEGLKDINYYILHNRENKVRKYINELHGYALEDNKKYQKIRK